ncbi:MAG TPA: dTDP-4-dehydrorhamnose reductase [Nitrospira sp.]|nr:dTDP-4-dehydrorhamnose reductase [Nitrospira sp.]
MRILITGANGQLGHALQQALAGEELILKDLPDFDLADPACEEQILTARPEVILHVGAYTNVDGAEREPDRARAVNVQGTTFVARAAEALQARLLYVSTDYVFDGEKKTPYTEDDVPHPLNQYGLSKYEGEQAAVKLCRNTLVVRTAWLYGYAGQNFVKTIMRLANEKPSLEVVADQRGCPTNAEDLARAMKKLLALDARGLCHVTNSGDCTWHDLAEAIVRQMGLTTVVKPITTAQAGRPAKRPAYSVLSQQRFSMLCEPLPHWQDALARFMKPMLHPAPAAS